MVSELAVPWGVARGERAGRKARRVRDGRRVPETQGQAAGPPEDRAGEGRPQASGQARFHSEAANHLLGRIGKPQVVRIRTGRSKRNRLGPQARAC